MTYSWQPQAPAWPFLAWLSVALAACALPAAAILALSVAPDQVPLGMIWGPAVSVSLMGACMIAASASGRFWIGVMLGLLTGAGLIVIGSVLDGASIIHPVPTGLAVVIASISFAARGALFARSASDKGWLVAAAVVAGEAAILVTAATFPGKLPDWLLALLPAQWASTAIYAGVAGAGVQAASSALLALAGTAGATLLVVRLWPRRWPYLVMFTVWLGFSALVWNDSTRRVLAETETVGGAGPDRDLPAM